MIDKKELNKKVEEEEQKEYAKKADEFMKKLQALQDEYKMDILPVQQLGLQLTPRKQESPIIKPINK